MNRYQDALRDGRSLAEVLKRQTENRPLFDDEYHLSAEQETAFKRALLELPDSEGRSVIYTHRSVVGSSRLSIETASSSRSTRISKSSRHSDHSNHPHDPDEQVWPKWTKEEVQQWLMKNELDVLEKYII